MPKQRPIINLPKTRAPYLGDKPKVLPFNRTPLDPDELKKIKELNISPFSFDVYLTENGTELIFSSYSQNFCTIRLFPKAITNEIREIVFKNQVIPIAKRLINGDIPPFLLHRILDSNESQKYILSSKNERKVLVVWDSKIEKHFTRDELRNLEKHKEIFQGSIKGTEIVNNHNDIETPYDSFTTILSTEKTLNDFFNITLNGAPNV